MIEIKNLSKTYRVSQRNKGLYQAFKTLFNPQFKIIQALDRISFNINQGEIVGYIGLMVLENLQPLKS